MKKAVIIDCDPGHDDVMALLLAFANENLDVKLVTVVAGNQVVEKTLQNTLNVLSYIDVDVEVAKGASKPLMRELLGGTEICHGESGLDGFDFPIPKLKASKRNAIEAMADVINKNNEKVTIVALGPLTNIALLLSIHPEVKEKIEMISLMGGACFGGNYTPTAEFNILVDPEAADIVFKSGISIVMCGLDVTEKALIRKEDIDLIRKIGNKTGIMAADLLTFFAQSKAHAQLDGAPLHDPCSVAYLIDDSLFEGKQCFVEIETKSSLTLGQTIVDYNDIYGIFGGVKKDKNVNVIFNINRDKYIDLIYKSIKRFA